MALRLRGWLIFCALDCVLGCASGVAHAEQCAFVTNTAAGALSVIDTARNTVAATISVTGASEITIDSAGAVAYAVTPGDDAMTVINTARKTVTATVSVGRQPVSITLTPDGRRAYVANRLSYSVSVIDTAARAVVGTFELPGREELVTDVSFFGAGIVGVSSDGTRLYVTRDIVDERLESDVFIYDTVTHGVLGGTGPSNAESIGGIAIAPNGARLYASAMGGAPDSEWYGEVVVMDTATTRVRTRIPIARDLQEVIELRGVALTPDGGRLYVANTSRNTVAVIDAAADRVSVEIPVGMQPRSLAMTSDGSLAYVVNQGAGTVSALNTATNTVTATIAVGGAPQGIAIAAVAEGCAAAVSNSEGSASGGCSLRPVGKPGAAGLTVLLALPVMLVRKRWLTVCAQRDETRSSNVMATWYSHDLQ